MAPTSTPSKKRVHEPGNDLSFTSDDESEHELASQHQMKTPPPSSKPSKRRRFDSPILIAEEEDEDLEDAESPTATASSAVDAQHEGGPSKKAASPLSSATTTSKHPTERPTVSTGPAAQVTESIEASSPPASPLPAATTPAAPTPSISGKNTKSLHDIPKLADRFVPKISTDEGVEYTNPHKFCLKPAYWKPWAPKLYSLFAEELTLQFDPVPFARKMEIPVEEVRHVFNALVCNPLYDAKEAMKRGEEGMKEMLEAYQTVMETRAWSQGVKGVEAVVGDFDGVGKGFVRIVAKDGSEVSRKVSELSVGDVVYLAEVKKRLGSADRKVWSEVLSAEDKETLNRIVNAEKEKAKRGR